MLLYLLPRPDISALGLLLRCFGLLGTHVQGVTMLSSTSSTSSSSRLLLRLHQRPVCCTS